MFRSQSFPRTNIQQQLKIQTLSTRTLGNLTPCDIIHTITFVRIYLIYWGFWVDGAKSSAGPNMSAEWHEIGVRRRWSAPERGAIDGKLTAAKLLNK